MSHEAKTIVDCVFPEILYARGSGRAGSTANHSPPLKKDSCTFAGRTQPFCVSIRQIAVLYRNMARAATSVFQFVIAIHGELCFTAS